MKKKQIRNLAQRQVILLLFDDAGSENSGKQRLDVPVESFPACKELYRRHYDIHIDNNTQLCAGGIPNEGACGGQVLDLILFLA